MTNFAVLSTNLVVRIVVVSVPVFWASSTPVRGLALLQTTTKGLKQHSASQGKYCDEKDEEMVTEM